MNTWALIAPGPSANAEDAERVRHLSVGAIGCAFELAPWADFVAASDAAWWRHYREASQLPGKRYCMGSNVQDAERILIPGLGTVVNSGVLALECAKRLGATRVLLLGLDMHGSHYFGPYTNGLSNTTKQRRQIHLQQYRKWAQLNRGVNVINCTQGSALECFTKARLEDAADLFGASPKSERARAPGFHPVAGGARG